MPTNIRQFPDPHAARSGGGVWLTRLLVAILYIMMGWFSRMGSGEIFNLSLIMFILYAIYVRGYKNTPIRIILAVVVVLSALASANKVGFLVWLIVSSLLIRLNRVQPREGYYIRANYLQSFATFIGLSLLTMLAVSFMDVIVSFLNIFSLQKLLQQAIPGAMSLSELLMLGLLIFTVGYSIYLAAVSLSGRVPTVPAISNALRRWV
jgi:hypothetical protein